MNIYKIKPYNIVKIGGIPVKLKTETAVQCGTSLENIEGLGIPDNQIEKLVGGSWLTLEEVKERNKK